VALVSIIIPIYKVADCIADSLQSALHQSYQEIEYILVNDCTPDNSMEIVERIIKQKENAAKDITILNLAKNSGLSNARNVGLLAAKGEFIFFMDSDDKISRNCIELHLNAIQRYSADFSDGNVSIVGGNHNIFKPYSNEKAINDKILNSYFNYLHICGWNKLIRKSFILSNKIYFKKGMLYEDMLWCYQLCKASTSYVTIPDNTYQYLIRAGSITTLSNNRHAHKQFSSFLQLLSSITTEFKEPTSIELQSLQRHWINKTLFVIKTRLLNAPFTNEEKKFYFRNLIPFAGLLTGYNKYFQKMPYTLFKIIFYIPNYLFRKLR